MKKYILLLLYSSFVFNGCKKNEAPAQDTPKQNIEIPNKTESYYSGKAGLDTMSLWDAPISAIHIDPNNSADTKADGTLEHPFAAFNKVKWANNLVIAIKRGTTLNSPAIILLGNDITIASYGIGERPIINSSASNDHAISTNWTGGKNITIRDIEVSAPNATSSIIIRDNSSNAKIINCKLHESVWGIRALNSNISGLLIQNTEVYNIKDDGMFIQNVENIEISNCYVHHVNLNWKPPTTPETVAGGDGIQFNLCNHWHVHHTKFDRSDTGNKFCFISNNPNQNDGIFEYNYLKGPIDCNSLYLGDGENLIVRYNFITAPSLSPVYSHSKNLQVYYNIFENIGGPIYADDADIYNNLFRNMQKLAIQGNTITAKNNIFDLGSPSNYRFKVTNLVEDHNIFVYGMPTNGSAHGKPMYADTSKSDYHLTAGSECIDKGVNVGLTHDFDGNKVPQGNAPDVGPFEFIP